MDIRTLCYYIKLPGNFILKSCNRLVLELENTRTRRMLKRIWRDAPKSIRQCPICNDSNFIEVSDNDRHGIGIRTVLCSNCGLGMTNPQPPIKLFQDFYKKYYWDLYFGRGAQYPKLLAYWRQQANGMVDNWAKYGINLSDCLVFELGCGPGYSLEAISSRWKCSVHALEPSTDEAERVRSIFPEASILVESVEGMTKLPEKLIGKCDFVYSTHVFEHVYDLKKAFGLLRDLVSEDGMAYIEVPDMEYNGWTYPHMLHLAHLWHFDEDTITYIASKFGFRKRAVFRGAAHCIKRSGLGIVFDVTASEHISLMPDRFQRNHQIFRNLRQDLI